MNSPFREITPHLRDRPLFLLEAEVSFGKLLEFLAPLSEASMNFSGPQIGLDAFFSQDFIVTLNKVFSRDSVHLQYWNSCWQVWKWTFPFLAGLV